MKHLKHPVITMVLYAVLLTLLVNIDLFTDINQLTYESIIKVILPIICIGFLTSIINLFITLKIEENNETIKYERE